jgi:hypothetical protein
LRVDNLEVLGLLIFLLAMYGQQVDRPMTHSTIALACGWRPDTLNQASIDKYEGDYQAVKPHLFTVLSALIRAKSMEEQAVAKSAIMGDCDFSEIFCAVSGLDARTSSDGPNPAFSAGAHEILRQQIVKVIFEGPRLATEYVHACFRYAMASCATSQRTQKSLAQSITSTLFTMTPELIAPIFGAEIGVDAEDFLSSCELGSLPAILQGRFRRVVERITIHLNSTWEKTRLPEVSTCFRSMTIPEYESDEVMAAKLAYASLHTEYGNA